jgi:hypothetical protein
MPNIFAEETTSTGLLLTYTGVNVRPGLAKVIEALCISLRLTEIYS